MADDRLGHPPTRDELLALSVNLTAAATALSRATEQMNAIMGKLYLKPASESDPRNARLRLDAGVRGKD